MREARIIVPHNGRLDIAALEDDMIAAFGGFTSYPAWGGWKNGQGQAVTESVTVYDIAAPIGHNTSMKLYSFAARLIEAGEEEVYIRQPNGHVELVRGEDLCCRLGECDICAPGSRP